MKAIICAAGQGKRLMPYTKDRPKSMVLLGGKPMISYTLDNLSKCDIKEIAVVIGYHAEKFREIIGESFNGCSITYHENKNYATTDNMTSLWMARDEIDDGFVFINADVMFQKEILKRLLDNPNPDVCVVDDSVKLSESAMKLRVENDKIVKIGRGLMDGNARAIGMYKFSAKGGKAYFEEIRKLMESGRKMLQIEQPLEMFLKRHDVHVTRTSGLVWEEIDEPNDLKKAEKNLARIKDD